MVNSSLGLKTMRSLPAAAARVTPCLPAFFTRAAPEMLLRLCWVFYGLSKACDFTLCGARESCLHCGDVFCARLRLFFGYA